MEFNKIIDQLLPNKRFVDESFAGDDILDRLKSNVSGWRRPKKEEQLVSGGFSPYDVKQGAIGDCYLISSMGVLGEKWIRAALGGCKSEGD